MHYDEQREKFEAEREQKYKLAVEASERGDMKREYEQKRHRREQRAKTMRLEKLRQLREQAKDYSINEQ